MSKEVKLLQKIGKSKLRDQVENQAKLGWGLLGSPFMLNGFPAQAMIKGNRVPLNPHYQVVYKDGNRSMEDRMDEMMDVGWKPFGAPFEFGGQAATAMVAGDIEDMTPGHEEVPPPPVQSVLKINHVPVGDGTYILSITDKNYYLVFDYPGTLKVTLPAMVATDEETFTCFVCNTQGDVDLLITNGNLVAYAPHADRGVTIGLTRGSANWYATGTNIKESQG